MNSLIRTILAWVAAMTAVCALAENGDFVLGPGDVVRITVFQNPDLTTEARVSESGLLSFPLVGAVEVGGSTIVAAERAIAASLRKGGYVLEPQVNIFPMEMRGNQVSVLGEVNKPGRYPLDPFNMRVADLVALAGGVAPTGADTVVLSGLRGGTPMRREIPLADLVARDTAIDQDLSGGDIIYVARAPVFYIYGEVQKPGAYRLERGMTLMQALATGGGLTLRGTERGMKVHRRDADGRVEILALDRNAPLEADDVVYVKESLF